MRRVSLSNAKAAAVALLDSHHDEIKRAFCDYLAGRVHPSNVVFDYRDARRRIWEAIYMDVADCRDRRVRRDEIFGETDGNQIWINPWCNHKEMVLTLVHEALHDSVHIIRATRQGLRKGLDIDSEHRVMGELDCCI